MVAAGDDKLPAGSDLWVSNKVPKDPEAVAKVIVGCSTVIEKALSEVVPEVFVALTVKLDSVVDATALAVPSMAPVLEFIVIPEGKLPD